jgi:hypothetical protein
MTGMLVCLSAAMLGVDYGWQPLADGGVEYIIQIEPQMLDSLQDGKGLTSALPASARNIRRYRIVVGSGELPHHGEPLPNEVEQATDGLGRGEAAAASRVGYDEPLERDSLPGELEPPELSAMPIESPYPSNYEKAGIPLPGPIASPALLAQEKPQLPAEPPRRREVSAPQEIGSAGYADTHSTSRPLVKPQVSQSRASEFPPRHSSEIKSPKTREIEFPEVPVREEPAGKLAANKPAEPAKELPAAAEEPESLSDPKPPAADSSIGKQSPTTLVGLFASLGGNVFLVWVASGQRNRYRALLRRSHEALAAASVSELPRDSHTDDMPRWERVTTDDALPDEE